jgi:CIC family chloride channel protein
MILPGTISVIKTWLQKIPSWGIQRLGKNTFLILVSILVGLISALAAVGLKMFVRFIHGIPDYFSTIYHTPLLYLVFPAVGIILTVVLIRFLFKERLEKGLGSIIFSILRKASIVEPDKMYSPLITSGITIGLGGSAGLEAPIVASGSAIGANIAHLFRLGYQERTLLLACGAASGIAAIFNSPIAGVVFAIEVLMIDLSVALFIPLLISTATATIVSKLLYSGQLFHLITEEWYIHALPWYALLGLICGFVSVYMTRVTLNLEGWFESKKQIWLKAIAGGLALSLMIFLFPPLYGEGYTTITLLLKGNYSGLLNDSIFWFLSEDPWMILIVAGVIMLLKVVATSVTIGSGGYGGIFAPSLFTGALTGFCLAYALNLAGIVHLQVTNFVAVGMAGIMAGVIHAPLTAIFLIAEITGGYMLFIPLMIVSAVSFLISRYFEPYTIYTQNLAKKGIIFSGSTDKNILNQLRLTDLIETGFVTLRMNDKFDKLIEAFTRCNRNVFPVVSGNDTFIGVVYLDDVKKLMFRPDLYEHLTIQEIAKTDILTLDVDEDVGSALIKFDDSGLWNIPVVDKGKYIGFISRSNLLAWYRKILKKSVTLF